MNSICTAKCLVHYENLWTFELTYPRYIHSEFMTHRMFSRNASSSRAVPVSKVIQQVVSNPVIPPKVYMNKAGMVGDVELVLLMLKPSVIFGFMRLLMPLRQHHAWRN